MKKYLKGIFKNITATTLQKTTFWASFSVVLLSLASMLVNLFGFAILGYWLMDGQRLIVGLVASSLLAGLDYAFWNIINRVIPKEDVG